MLLHRQPLAFPHFCEGLFFYQLKNCKNGEQDDEKQQPHSHSSKNIL